MTLSVYDINFNDKKKVNKVLIEGVTKLVEIEPNERFYNTENKILGIKYLDLELNEKTFTEISNEDQTIYFTKPGETANAIPQLIVKE